MGDGVSAREVAALLVERLRNLDFAGFAELFAEESVFEHPFQTPGSPPSIHGRAAIREYLVESRAAVRSLIELSDIETTVHETTDPGVVVVESVVSGTTVATGQPFRFASAVNVITVRDGQVVRFRDYTNPLGAARATGVSAR
jgi:uncharacterized protein